MKRSDLQVGGEYYYDRSADWAAPVYGRGEKAVLVDDKRYSINRVSFGIRREERYREDPKGNCVLVDVYRPVRDEEHAYRTVVPTAHLRGPWETTKAEVEAAVEARRKQDQSAEEQRQAQHAAAKAAVDRAKALGLDGVSWTAGYSSNAFARSAPTLVTMSPETAAKLLDAYEDREAAE